MLKGSLAGTKCSTPGSLVRPVFLTFFAFLFGKSRGPNYRYSTTLARYNAIISRWHSGDAFRGRGARTSGCSWYFRASLFLYFFFFFHEIMLVSIIDLVFFSCLDRASKNIYPITRTLPIVLSHFTALSWCWTKYFLVLSLSYF